MDAFILRNAAKIFSITLDHFSPPSSFKSMHWKRYEVSEEERKFNSRFSILAALTDNNRPLQLSNPVPLPDSSSHCNFSWQPY